VGLSLAPADRPVTFTFVAPIAQGGMGYLRRKGPTVEKVGGEGGHLAVPLFMEWR
jgi:hypothetical protein